jgi:TatD DNase family protein
MVTTRLIDSHCHIDAAAFDADRDAVVARARARGVDTQIVPAIALDGFAKLRAICARMPGLVPAYGLHPMYLARHASSHLRELSHWLARERPVAVGECGLDHFVPDLDRDAQRACFDGQLRLAREFDLPLILHARRAVDEVTAAIRRIGGLRGVVHSFSGSREQAAALWKLGFLIGIGGPVTHPRANRLRGLVATMPLEFLLLETDSPDQPSTGHRGERNEPAYLTDVLVEIAGLRDTEPVDIAAATTANARRLFALARPDDHPVAPPIP